LTIFYIICRKWYHYRHFEFFQGTSRAIGGRDNGIWN